MPPSRRRKITKIIRYLVVVLLTTAALLLAAFMPDQQIQPLFFLYLGAAMVAGWYGGWKSGMLITPPLELWELIPVMLIGVLVPVISTIIKPQLALRKSKQPA